MESRVLKQDSRVFLSYDLPHRIRCSAIYPAQAPNGSTIIFYGHDRGLRILWRGGRKIKQDATQAQTNDGDVILLGDDQDDSQLVDDEVKYEEDLEELDADSPFPEILYDLDIPFPTPVTKLAVPETSTTWTSGSQTAGQVAIALAGGETILLAIPLAPVSKSRGFGRVNSIIQNGKKILRQEAAGYVHDLCIKTSDDNEKTTVASLTDVLSIWQISSFESDADVEQQTVLLSNAARSIAFNPAPRSTQILVTDVSGLISIYDATAELEDEAGRWIVSLHSPFTSEKSHTIPARKKILDAKWVMTGRCVFAVFDDGEWGVWDLLQQSNRSLEDFAMRGFLGSAASTDSSETVQKRAALAPMTPNTRKQKSTTFFGTRPKTTTAASRGIISVSRSPGSAGSVSESILLCHNNEIFTIPSMQAFWQRTASESGLGSLHSPGLIHIQSCNLYNENITSLSQFSSRLSANQGKLNTVRDFVLSTEHRLYIVQSKQQGGIPIKSLVPSNEARDQRMLDAGELDLNGMDRILGNMNADSRHRKVGFAH